ncbi:MAG: ATP-dependent DNA ligase [Actinomycetales bacterium]
MRPPVAPMLARLEPELPVGGWSYEPKWDGFRCLAFCEGGEVHLRSRNQRPLARYFPEVVSAVHELGREVVLDGELVIWRDGVSDFPAMLARLHPARSRVELLSGETPAQLIVFDVLSIDAEDLLSAPFERRRQALLSLVAPTRRLAPTPASDDVVRAAEWLDAPPGAGIDGVVAKAHGSAYQPGKRSMVKVKRQRSVDCVVAGCRRSSVDEVSSLLLGLWNDAGELVHVGVVANLARLLRRELAVLLDPFVTSLEGHPWERGFGLEGGALGRLKGTAGRWTPEMERDWLPLRPELVCEVGFDHVEGHRFRHPARFRHWRPDRDARSCRVEQLWEGR